MKIIRKMVTKNIVIPVLIILLAGFGVYQYVDKQKYINYMSQDLNDDLGNMNRSIILSNGAFKRILSTKELTYKDAKFLDGASEVIYNTLLSYHDIATHDLKRGAHADISTASEDAAIAISWYISALTSKHAADKEPIQLSRKQLEQIQAIKNLSDIWREEVLNHANDLKLDNSEERITQMFLDGEYLDIYEDNSIIKDHWVKLLVQLSTRTEEHFDGLYPNGVHDFGGYLSLN